MSLGNEDLFTVRSGTRITGKGIRENPGDLPIYSCYKNSNITKGSVDANYFSDELGGEIEDSPFVSINANGASVGKVFARRDVCGITDDVIAVEIKKDGIDLDYLTIALRSAIDKEGFLYEAKLFTTRAKDLEVSLPVDQQGNFDTERQEEIASAVKRFNVLRSRLHDVGVRSSSARAVSETV